MQTCPWELFFFLLPKWMMECYFSLGGVSFWLYSVGLDPACKLKWILFSGTFMITSFLTFTKWSLEFFFGGKSIIINNFLNSYTVIPLLGGKITLLILAYYFHTFFQIMTTLTHSKSIRGFNKHRWLANNVCCAA